MPGNGIYTGSVGGIYTGSVVHLESGSSIVSGHTVCIVEQDQLIICCLFSSYSMTCISGN